jgi:hypothetical protein
MGSTAVMIAAVSVATAIICLCVGYFLGRTNVRLRVEDALKKERISADAREYTLRQQLEDKMAENADLRARVEELTRFQDPLEQLKRRHIKESAAQARQDTQSNQEPPVPAEEEAPVIDSADERVQNLLKSIEDKLKQPANEPPIQPLQMPEEPPFQVDKLPEPTMPLQPIVPAAVKPTPLAPTPVKVPVVSAPAVPVAAVTTTVVPSPAASASPVATPAVPPPAVKDEWQEFAASLASLTRGKK